VFRHFFNIYISFNFEDIDYVHDSFDYVFIPNCEAILSTFKFHCHSNFNVVEVKPFIVSIIAMGIVTKVNVVKGSID
jgi:hypothetical protein